VFDGGPYREALSCRVNQATRPSVEEQDVPAVRSATRAQRITCGREDKSVPQAISPPFGPGGNSLTFV
jgi:hypothetical protein